VCAKDLLRPHVFDHRPQRDGIVVLYTSGTKDERYRAALGAMGEVAEQLARGFPTGLAPIPGAELPPARGIMAEPPSQLPARCQVLRLCVETEIFLAASPRPQPVDQYPVPIVSRRRIVDTLYLNRHVPSLGRSDTSAPSARRCAKRCAGRTRRAPRRSSRRRSELPRRGSTVPGGVLGKVHVRARPDHLTVALDYGTIAAPIGCDIGSRDRRRVVGQ